MGLATMAWDEAVIALYAMYMDSHRNAMKRREGDEKQRK
jgi:hypothetical protein